MTAQTTHLRVATAPSFDDDVLRLVQIQAAIKDMEAEQDAIRTRIRAHGPGRVGDLRVSVTTNRRFSPVLAAERLTADQLTEIAETTLSGAKAKRVLPPAVYESLLYEVGEPRVSVR